MQPSSGTKHALRSDIQGLRALAVGLVVVYHLHGAALPGGFVGVDVFFVISGFLITSHLVGRPPRGVRDLGAFWGRRLRRLLPASLVVLLATLLAVRLFSPETVWQATATDARAAALYVVNWALAGQAIDYLAADNAPTAVQHFWSLSVEEQFYFGWPLLVGAVALLARRRGISARGALAAAFAVVTAGSFAWSVHLTSSNPAAAYFVTPTRIWELAAGGLLAVLVAGRDAHDAGRRVADMTKARRPERLIGAWAGVAMIAAAAVLYTSETPFPGHHAALPVIGTVLLLGFGASRDDRLSPGPILALRPVQWLGDVSYSVYLWHWPLIVVTTAWSGHDLGWRTGAVVLALTLVLAGLTERFVERPFRTAGAARSLRRTYGVAVAAMAVVVGIATVQVLEVQHREDQADRELAAALRDGGPCLGAAALDDGADCPEVPYERLLPSVSAASSDLSEAYGEVGPRSCFASEPEFESVDCVFGDSSADVTVTLFGNSHAAQWLPAVQAIADQRGWRISTHFSARCATADIPQEFDRSSASASCVDWVQRTADEIVRTKPDLVVVTNRPQALVPGKDREESDEEYADGYTRILREITTAEIPVLAIRDTPDARRDVPGCIAERGDDYRTCDGPRDRWLPYDPIVDAVDRIDDDRLRLVDLTDRFCGPQVCTPVIGGVIAYLDSNHITATFAQTLAPYLAPYLDDALER
ncbi:hypothetical protein ASE01_02050 [Nocardioides sp. Root190]|uniref:acyltransferase family protein n=1 Tax=Nocardioides sp. Root190 TaxID=1736488 RepID=UPI0006FA2611|nr:acyltransferase family protein [Nocardioides sp. Root190]KRB80294.1 hypothetical protein ASE01_02050 [Nocardioides sp. Root190]